MELGLNRRFNLLLLDHNEVLFESAAVISLDGSGQVGVDGRLWICSRCIVFEPKEFSKPLEKFRYNDMDAMPTKGLVESSNMGKREAILVDCKSVTEMKTDGKSHPYITEEKPLKRVFVLKHGSLEKILGMLERLWDIQSQVKQEPRISRETLETTLLDSVCEPRLTKSFDKSRLIDFREVLLTPKEIRVSLVSQFTNIPGCIMLSDQRLYFQPAELNNIGQVVQSYPLKRLTSVYRRRFLLRQRALEVRFERENRGYSSSTKANHWQDREISLLLFFEEGAHVRDLVYELLEGYLSSNLAPPPGSPPNMRRNSIHCQPRLDQLTRSWQNRELSNFEYLMQLNTLADRSVADLTQYPVFPWVIADYESSVLDLTNPKSFRDLSKPIGALNLERLEQFKERFHHMRTELGDPSIKPFLYGTHYSTPGYVLFFLVRKSPDLMLRLQNGHFDRPDRSFHSVAATWNSVLNNTADLKELIPEFYDSDGEFLLNSYHLDLGRRQDGTFVDDVILPPWAADPRDFIQKCREALESDYVSAHLHEWIDLIFGYKQRGENAIKFDNLFYYLTYEGAVDLDTVQDPNERKSYEAQISEFGQTPKQLFAKPHPNRNATILVDTVEQEELITKTPTAEVADSNHYENDNMQQHEVDTSLQAGEDDDDGEQKEEENAKMENRVHYAQEEVVDNKSFTSSPSQSPRKPVVVVEEKRPSTPPQQAMSIMYSKFWRSETNSIQTYECRMEQRLHRGPISGICGRGGTQLFSVSHDGSMSEMGFMEDEDEMVQVKRRFAIGKLSLSSCIIVRDCLLIGSWDNCLYVNSVEQGRIMNRIVAHEDAVSCISTDGSSGRVVATGSWESSIKIWKFSSKTYSIQPLCSIYDHSSEVICLKLDSAGLLLVSGGSAGHIFVHDLRLGGDLVHGFKSCVTRGTFPILVDWSRDETKVLVCAADGVVEVFDLVSGRTSPVSSTDARLPPGSHVTSAAMTPDRLCIVFGTSCGRVYLCNVDLLGSISSRNAIRMIWKTTNTLSSIDLYQIGRFSNITGDQAISSIHCCSEDMIAVGNCAGMLRILSYLKKKE